MATRPTEEVNSLIVIYIGHFYMVIPVLAVRFLRDAMPYQGSRGLILQGTPTVIFPALTINNDRYIIFHFASLLCRWHPPPPPQPRGALSLGSFQVGPELLDLLLESFRDSALLDGLARRWGGGESESLKYCPDKLITHGRLNSPKDGLN